VALTGEEVRDYVVPVLNLRPGRVLTALGPVDLEALDLLASVASHGLEVATRYREVSESEARSRYQAYHGDLTGLANRSLLQLSMREALSHSDGRDYQAADGYWRRAPASSRGRQHVRALPTDF